eukprot:CAMPEP_0197436974 /NCGR_PEP_ID=MMETSP1175-20131217/4295_1 /TAXON_ID=1003142 /ORGANISM="Triceratium dubium, Strain CCMP147" /LENGTH=357 /DNA_ID=CAMNT_0042966381 /DNA_START=566 /DNA_END=1640 /DNA_ORIENTATION=-
MTTFSSQEIIWRRVLDGHPPRLLRCRIKNLEASIQVFIQFKYCRHVAAPVAVIWRRPHRHQRVVEHAPMSLHYQLMRPRDEIQVVPLVEHGNDVPTKEVTGTTRAKAPTLDLLRVGPHEVTHRPVVGNLLLPIDDSDLVQGVDAGAQPAVDREDLILDDGAETEVVEYLCAIPPHIDAPVLAQALVVEAVDLRDLTALVISTDERDAIRVTHLESEKQKEGFHGVVAPVDEVAKEEVILVWALAPDFKQLDEVVELAVDVTTYRDRSVHPLHVALVHQYLPCSQAQGLHFSLPKILAPLESLDLLVWLEFPTGAAIAGAAAVVIGAAAEALAGAPSAEGAAAGVGASVWVVIVRDLG